MKGEGSRPALLPIGCFEQHGPELPLDTDILQAEELARRLAARLAREKQGRPTVLPSIPFTPTDPNKGFAGTVTVSGDAFRAYFESVLRGVLDTSYSSVVVVNSHGSVDALLKEIGFKLVFEQFENGTNPVRPILCVNVYDAATKTLERFGQAPGRHADWTEFLMTYHLLGSAFYSEERLERLRAFAEDHEFTVRMPAVLGIPARLRSVDGVQGEPWPRAEHPLAELAAEYWNFVEEECYQKMVFELEDFARRFARE